MERSFGLFRKKHLSFLLPWETGMKTCGSTPFPKILSERREKVDWQWCTLNHGMIGSVLKS